MVSFEGVSAIGMLIKGFSFTEVADIGVSVIGVFYRGVDLDGPINYRGCKGGIYYRCYIYKKRLMSIFGCLYHLGCFYSRFVL